MHDLTPTLFRHARRPEWGLAILESETTTHRRFQFQDGQLRTFRRGFYELLEPVDRPLDESLRITEKLEAARDMSIAREEILETSETPVVKLWTRSSTSRPPSRRASRTRATRSSRGARGRLGA
jgi:hypothetical protein